jgi:hypothetical protein
VDLAGANRDKNPTEIRDDDDIRKDPRTERGRGFPKTNREARAAVLVRVRALIAFALTQAREGGRFAAFERALIGQVMALARAVVVLFLVASEERVRGGLGSSVECEGRRFRKAPAQTRNLLTWFGVVQYERTYLREIVKPKQAAHGYHPLDAELGLLADRISPNVLSVATRLSTRVSFGEAHEVAGWFLPAVPSTEVIEAAVLGYGSKTQEWFEQVLVPTLLRDAVLTPARDEWRRGSRARRSAAWVGKGGGERDGGSKRQVVVRGEGGADREVVAPEQGVQLVEAGDGDEDGDEGAVRRRGVTVESAVEGIEGRVMGEPHFLGGDESRVEDGERGERWRGAQLRGSRDGGEAHVTSVRAEAMGSAVTALALAMAAAMRP